MQEGKKRKTTVEAIKEIAKPIAENLGLSLWDVRFLKEGSQWYLRIFIDREEGVSISDCESMSRALDKPLEDKDPIPQSYCLEVCSPGIERELITDEQFNKFIGSNVYVKLIRPNVSGNREFTGELLEIESEGILLKKDEEIIRFKRKEIANVRLTDKLINNSVSSHAID